MSGTFNVLQLARLLSAREHTLNGRAEQLSSALENLVVTGQLPAGVRLPSERQLSVTIGMSRTTVGAAFDRLREMAIFVSRQGVGTFVSGASCGAVARGDARLQSFLCSTSHRIDLRSASLEAVPGTAAAIATVNEEDYREVLRTNGYFPQGLPVIRQAVADYYTAQNLRTTADQVLITAGSQQGINLLAQCLIEPGDTIVVEEPTYRGLIESFRSRGARLIGVHSDQNGVDVSCLEDVLRKTRVRLVALLTTVHNPTGSVLPEAKRREVCALCQKYDVTLVDHAAPSDTLIDGERPRPLAAFGEKVVTAGSASKGYWGGFRIGWLRAENPILGNLVAAKGAEDLGTSIPAQLTVARLLPHIEAARRYRRETLGHARDAILKDLQRHIPAWTPMIPRGGASLWLRLPQGQSATGFVELASREGIDLLAGPIFSTRNAMDDHIRLTYALDREIVADAVARLGHIWHSVR
jgi:DNA-binding transcriptional MocR family regulator